MTIEYTGTMHLIANPKSGRKQAAKIVQKVCHALQAANCHYVIYQTAYPNHSERLLKQINLRTKDTVVVLGGDGTIHNVINGMLARSDQMKVPLSIIPCGTGNDIASALGIDSIDQAVNILLHGKIRSIDLGLVQTAKKQRYMLLCLLWGYAFDLANFADRNRWLGGARYTLAGYIQFLKQAAKPLKMIVDGNPIEDTFRFFMIVNSPCAGNGKLIAPNAELADQKFDLVLIRNISKWQFFKTMLGMQRGKIHTSSHVEFYQFKQLKLLEKDIEHKINLDSELILTTPASISVLPKALQVYA